ncbi:MAG: hypothetical protein WAT37_10145, partial [Saprospiraceae bacterium]
TRWITGFTLVEHKCSVWKKILRNFKNAYLPLLTFGGYRLQIVPSLDKLIIRDENPLWGAKVFDIEWIYFQPISFLQILCE